MKKNSKIDKIVDSWIDSIEIEPTKEASAFFKSRVLNHIDKLKQPAEGTGLIDKLFLRISLAAIFILIVMNFSVIKESLKSNTESGYTVEEVVSAYSNVDADSYNNYSLLVYENNK